MCTVSFYKDKDTTILTSNRDEHNSRLNAMPPQVYQTDEYQLIYCKDAKANGTWMALRNDGTVTVLLNGAFERHPLQPPYKRSRGLVLLDIIKEENCLQKYKEYDFTTIEPFTLVLYSHSHLYECIWDGVEKFITEKSTDEKHLWSSVTLYDDEFRQKKQALYQRLTESKVTLSNEEILKFHHSEADLENGFIINRNNQLVTFSVTQIILGITEKIFYHHDILEDKTYSIVQDEYIEKSIL